MIVCRSCGHQNADATEFCTSCGTYLAWDGERQSQAGPAASPQAPAAPPPVESAPPERRSRLVDHVLGAVRPQGARTPPAGAAGTGTGALPTAPWPGPTTGAGTGAGAGWPAGGGGPDQPGGGQPAAGPSAAGQPAGGQPAGGLAATSEFAPVKPAPEQRLPPPDRTPPPAPARRPGALYCTACGADNDSDRRLCRSCGAELVRPQVKRPPWWRRLFQRSAPAVGERPGRRRRARSRRGRRVFRIVVAAVLVAAVALLAGPWRSVIGSAYRKVTGLVTTRYDPVKPVSATATSVARGHPANLAIDGVKDTAWAEGVRGLGANQSLTIVLGRKVDLTRIGITPGASDNEKKFRAQPRPREIRLVFGNGTSQTVTLTDKAEFQPFSLAATGVDKVTLELLSVYSGQSGQDTSIAEVEFFVKG